MPARIRQQLESVFRRGPLTIAAIYLVLGLLWIFFSDDLAVRIAGGNQNQLHLLSTFKGFGYILVTAILLYIMILFYARRITEGQEALEESVQQTRILNRKLALMNDVTYQDIQNKVTAVRGLVHLSLKARSDDDRTGLLSRGDQTLDAVHTLIEKTRVFQKVGVSEERWIDAGETIRTQFALISRAGKVTLSCDLHGLEVWADPQIEQVFSILCLNAVTHGGAVTRISFTCRETPGGLVLVCEDDGTGIPAGQKAEIFNRVVGGTGRFHLFFVREFLTLYGMGITETGEPGKGARFEITVPQGAYRFGNG